MTVRDQVVADIIANTVGASADITKFHDAVELAGMAVNTLKQALQATFESAQLGAQYQSQAEAFNNIAAAAGQSGDAILAAMKKAAAGTIDEMSLMASASRGTLTGLSVDVQAQLIRIARAGAAATGESVGFLLESLNTGLARMSPLLLDNVAGMTGLSQEVAKMKASMGDAAESMSDAETRNLLLNAVLEKGQQIIADVGLGARTGAEDFQAWEAASKDLNTAMGELAQEGLADLVRVGTLVKITLAETIRSARAEAAAANAIEDAIGGNRALVDPDQFRGGINFATFDIDAVLADSKNLATIRANMAADEAAIALENKKQAEALQKIKDLMVTILDTRSQEVQRIDEQMALIRTIGDEDFGLKVQRDAALAVLQMQRDELTAIKTETKEMDNILRDSVAKSAMLVDDFDRFLDNLPPAVDGLEAAAESLDEMAAAMERLGESLVNLSVSGLGDLAMLVGEAAAGSTDFAAGFKSILGDLLKQTGLLLMGAGAELLIVSGGTSPAGWGLLAGGAALAGLGAYIGAKGSKDTNPGSFSSAGGSGGGRSGSSYRATDTGPPMGQRLINVYVQGDIYTEDKLESKILSIAGAR